MNERNCGVFSDSAGPAELDTDEELFDLLGKSLIGEGNGFFYWFIGDNKIISLLGLGMVKFCVLLPVGRPDF